MTSKPLLNEWLEFLAEPAVRQLQQFGQSGDSSTFNGATGCTHTCLQILIRAKTGKTVTHDQISRIAGYPWPAYNPNRRGLRTSTSASSELMKVVNYYHLPYKAVFFNRNLNESIQSWLNRVQNAYGPVLVGVKYDWQPEHKGTVYNGLRADGKPNGYAETGGKTQLYGFSGAHAELRVGYDELSDGQYHDWWRDPNHGSPSRPEKPAFDRFKTKQGYALIQSYRHLLINGDPRSLMFVVPTSKFAPR